MTATTDPIDTAPQRPYRVLVVCAHNRARSVMAAALLRWYLPPGFTVASAGFGPEGKPAIPDVVRLLATRGIDASSHRSRVISRELVQGADLVLTAERTQVLTILTELGREFDRTYTMPEFALGGFGERPRGMEYLKADIPEVDDPTGRSEVEWQTVWSLVDGWMGLIASKLERSAGR
jgi:protein-tyrosine phosphatase